MVWIRLRRHNFLNFLKKSMCMISKYKFNMQQQRWLSIWIPCTKCKKVFWKLQIVAVFKCLEVVNEISEMLCKKPEVTCLTYTHALISKCLCNICRNRKRFFWLKLLRAKPIKRNGFSPTKILLLSIWDIIFFKTCQRDYLIK